MLDSQLLVAVVPVSHTKEFQIVPWASVPVPAAWCCVGAVLGSQLLLFWWWLLFCGDTCGAELTHNFTLQSCECSKRISNPAVWLGFALLFRGIFTNSG